ncbi:MAG: bifunctional (p)ppGpp synthetase/guanosine-3',5'-bis(diphosphate) 3'-pyrophosphohydrolase [Pseudomonadales bacterium]
MVEATRNQRQITSGALNLEEWLTAFSSMRGGIDLERIKKACELSRQAEQKALATVGPWAEGRSSYLTGLEMADILLPMNVDEPSLVAAVIYRAVRENQITLNHVRNQFGAEVASLVEGVLKMAAISNIHIRHDEVVLGQTSDQIDQAKKMLIALVDDVRVALIKLAERTCAIRAASKTDREKQLRLAHEMSEIYAPLAHRLGIGHLRWELEDLSFRYVDPDAYKRIAVLLDEKRTARQAYIEEVLSLLKDKLHLVGVEAELQGRAKHISSIWKKMMRKGIKFSEVYDVRAIRILVPTSDDCYRALGVVHNLWRNIPNEFDDYIANPKGNGYKSLHTAVIGPEGKVLEVQIRTEEMHIEAEYGVCSHWQYKTNADVDKSARYERRLELLRQVIEWQSEVKQLPASSKEVLANVSLDRVYLFTPDGHVIDMPPESTPVDFAYRVHTEIGHRCRGAKINGRIVPLNHRLQSGDRVEIVTGDDSAPRREWLHSHLGYVTTSRAKSKIQGWFHRQARQKNIEEGQRVLEAELKHLGLDQYAHQDLNSALGYTSDDDLLFALGSGDLELSDVVEEIARAASILKLDSQMNLGFEAEGKVPSLISGIGDRAHSVAQCCQPIPGDAIAGILEDDGVVTVHMQDCVQVLNADVYGRLMRLSWQDDIQESFNVNLEVLGYDRPGILFEIAGLFVTEQINISMLHSESSKETGRVEIQMSIEVGSIKPLIRVLELIQQIPNVASVRRLAA